MYNMHGNGLGEEPSATEPSLWDSVLKLGTNVVTQGFNIYNKVQNLTQQQKVATAAQQQAQQMAQYAAMYGQPVPGQPMIPGQPVYGQPAYGQSTDFLGGWTWPLLIGGVALVGVFLLKRK